MRPGQRVTLPQAQPHKPLGTVLRVTDRGVEVQWQTLLGPPDRSWWAPADLRVLD